MSSYRDNCADFATLVYAELHQSRQKCEITVMMTWLVDKWQGILGFSRSFHLFGSRVSREAPVSSWICSFVVAQIQYWYCSNSADDYITREGEDCSVRVCDPGNTKPSNVADLWLGSSVVETHIKAQRELVKGPISCDFYREVFRNTFSQEVHLINSISKRAIRVCI